MLKFFILKNNAIHPKAIILNLINSIAMEIWWNNPIGLRTKLKINYWNGFFWLQNSCGNFAGILRFFQIPGIAAILPIISWSNWLGSNLNKDTMAEVRTDSFGLWKVSFAVFRIVDWSASREIPPNYRQDIGRPDEVG